jgi:hypothetical protein
MSLNLYAAHHQWATRPADERFWGLDDLSAALTDKRGRSYERQTLIRSVRVDAVEVPGCDSPDLSLMGSRGPITLTHWAFGQLCGYADAPASYIRGLPAPLAAANLNHGLVGYHGDGVQLLLHRNGEYGSGDFTVRSLTTAYSRLWNLDVVRALRPATELCWRVPPARPAADDPRARPATAADILPDQGDFGLSVRVGDPIAPAGVYAGDRDMFVFLVNPERVVDDGVRGLMRGVFVWNSEVGAGAFRVRTFLLENVCGNHIVWGAGDVKELRIVHKGRAIDGAGQRLVAQLREFSEGSEAGERLMVRRARSYVLGGDRQSVIDRLFEMKSLGLSRQTLGAAYDTAERWEYTALAPPTTAWGFVHGLTRYSQETPYADERHRLDVAGGKVLALAAG